MAAKRGEARRFLLDVVLNYDGDGCLIWPFDRNPDGYGKIKIGGKNYVVSRFVCMEHGPAPTDKHHAAHSCGRGKQGCVTKSHVSWKTRLENEADKIKHGTHLRGELQNGAKLTEADVIFISRMRGRISQKNLAERFSIAPSTVSYIHTRKNWAWLTAPIYLHEPLAVIKAEDR